MKARSKVMPVSVSKTGSAIRSPEMGQTNSLGGGSGLKDEASCMAIAC